MIERETLRALIILTKRTREMEKEMAALKAELEKIKVKYPTHS